MLKKYAEDCVKLVFECIDYLGYSDILKSLIVY